MDRQFRAELRRHVGDPDMAIPDDLADLANRLERKLAGNTNERAAHGREQGDD
jgi:hypothetical protein